MRTRRALRRWITGAVIAATAWIAMAGPAWAHIEVTADKPQAGATDVTLSFDAESESPTAGIVSLQVQLPTGIAPADVTWVSGPAGWSLTAAADGYTVAGPAVAAGKDAEYQVKIAKLPEDATSLAFKTLQTYSDGRVDRWIEIPKGTEKVDNPAPALALAPAAPAATTSAPTPTATTTPTATATESTASSDGGSSNAWIWLIAAVAVLGGIAVVLFSRKRGNTPS